MFQSNILVLHRQIFNDVKSKFKPKMGEIRTLKSMLDKTCTFEVTGNANKDVELCIIHGLFNTDFPAAIKEYTGRKYDQILSGGEPAPLVKVKGSMTALDETIWLLRNMEEVYEIHITSPTARLEELDLYFKLSLWHNSLKHFGGLDILSLNQSGEFLSPSEALIDLRKSPFDASMPHLFMSINVKAGSFFSLSFLGRLKESFSPPLVTKHVPLVCKMCGAPLHGGKCDYCGTEY